MGTIRATAYPSRYANEPDEWEREKPCAAEHHRWEQQSVGKFYLQFDSIRNGWPSYPDLIRTQRELAKLIGHRIKAKPRYQRSEQHYRIEDWIVCENRTRSPLFDADEAERVLTVLQDFQAAGWLPDETVDIHFRPNEYDAHLITNLCTIMQARNELLVQALELTEDIQIIVGHDLAFGIPLSAFSFEKLEACIFLLRQSSLWAETVGTARMKPSDNSNPRFQMRSWLLRLGFIGDTFARPRQTLLSRLDGDTAFFDERGKQRAAALRKARRLAE